MSYNVSDPFYTKKERKNNDNLFGLGDIPDLFRQGKEVVQMFKPTPEQQQAKAGVWYNMLKTFVRAPDMRGAELGRIFKNALPFSQRKTKDRFIANNLTGKSRVSIIKHLVTKINDELVKGGFQQLSKAEILQGMGVGEKQVTVSAAVKQLIPTSVKAAANGGAQEKVTAKEIGSDVAFDVVRPLRPTMVSALKMKGITPSKKIDILTNQFYNNVVRTNNLSNFTGKSSLPEMNIYDYASDSVDAATDAIITAVVQYARNLKAKEENGDTLTKLEQNIVDNTRRAEDIVKQSVKDAAAQQVGKKILFENQWLYIIGGVVVFIIIILVAKK